MLQLRPYQADIDAKIVAAQASGARNVAVVCPTGGGKTVNMAYRFVMHQGASIGIAHRQELVGQMSLALARCGVRHRIIGSDSTRRNCVTVHMLECGRSFYDPNAWVGVAGVDTLIRMPADNPWFKQITLWQTDETHHLLRTNKWGKAVALFPNALGIGWTATPNRADGYGLGRHADGVMDALISGPTMRELIGAGYLTDYRIFCPPSDLDLSDVTVSAGGDFSPPKLRAAVHKSHIVGDIVKHYLRIAPGKLGVTFAVDIEHATEIAQAYRAADVRCEVVTANTPDPARIAILRRFRAGDIKQLVNVDLFGEGFDLPAIEVCSMGRPTASFPLYAQQFGRALRLLDGKRFGIIIDHVGNVTRHGLPDAPHAWSLDRRERRGAKTISEVVPVRVCPECTAAYERTRPACPYCGHRPEPASRAAPAYVDGDLVELEPGALASLRGEIARIDGAPVIPAGLSRPAIIALYDRHRERQAAQRELRAVMALWAGWQRDKGLTESERQRTFFFAFGVDVATAQTLNTKDAGELQGRVQTALNRAAVVSAA